MGVAGTAQQLRSYTALIEGLGSLPNTCMVVHNHLEMYNQVVKISSSVIFTSNIIQSRLKI